MLNLRPEYILLGGMFGVQILIVYFWWRYLARQFKSTYRAYDTLIFTAIFSTSIAILIYIVGNKLDLNFDLLLWLSVWPLILVISLQFVIFNLEVEAMRLILSPLPTFIVGCLLAIPVGLNVIINDIIDPIIKVQVGSLPVVVIGYLLLNVLVAALIVWKYPRLIVVSVFALLVSGVGLPIYAYLSGQLRVQEMSFWEVIFLICFLAMSAPILATNAKRRAAKDREIGLRS